MKSKQVIAHARSWVEQHGSKVPGFCGAHLLGSILRSAPDAPFPSYRDVDINLIVLDESHPTQTNNVDYNGLILEFSTVSSAGYRSAEAVLANPELASNLA